MMFTSRRLVARLLIVAVCSLLVVQPARAAAPQWLAIGPCNCNTRVVALRPGEPETIFAGTETNGLFVSYDQGSHWAPIDAAAGLPAQTIIALAFDPQNANTMYLATATGLYKSIDGGAHWTAPTTSIGGVILAVKVDPSDSATVYVGDMQGLAKSADGGSHFQRVFGPPLASVEKIAAVREAPGRLLVGLFSTGISYSANSGGTWSTGTGLAAGVTGRAILISPLDPTLVLAGTDNVISGGTVQGLFKSIDGGQQWVATGIGIGQQAVYALAAGTYTTVYAGTASGVYASWGGADNWTLLGSGLPSAIVHDLAVHPDGTGLVYAATGSGLYTIRTGSRVYFPLLSRG